MSNEDRSVDEGPLEEEEPVVLREATEDDALRLFQDTMTSAPYASMTSAHLYALANQEAINIDSPVLQPAMEALQYQLHRRKANGRDEIELALNPLNRERAPRRFEAATIAAWQKMLPRLTHPAARAHLLDLFISHGGPDTPTNATEAICAYTDHAEALAYMVSAGHVEVSSAGREELRIAQTLGRTLSLIHIASVTESGRIAVERAVNSALAQASRMVQSVQPRVGSAMMLISCLVSARKQLNPNNLASLKSLIDEALSAYKDHDHIVDQLADLSVRVDPTTREATSRLRVTVRLTMAETRAPMAAMHFLEQAAKIASKHNLRDLEDEAVRRMQGLSNADMGFQRISAKSSLPPEFIEAEVVNYSYGNDWRESLASWLNSPPPSGMKADNELFAHEAAQFAPFSSILPTTTVGADNLPRWTATSDEDRHAAQRANAERMKMQLMGAVLAAALDRIKEQHGMPPVEELALFLSENGQGNFELANALARSFIRYWDGDLEGSMHTTVVRVEAAARALVLLLDEPAYRVARSTRPNKYVGLEELLTILLSSQVLDDSWDRFIRALLLDPTGFTLRHNLAHGFIVNVPPAQLVALALRALSLFVTMLWAPPDAQ